MSPKHRIRRIVAALAVSAVALGVVPAVVPGGAQATNHSDKGPGGEYHPLDPTRIFDSRDPALDAPPLGKKPTSSAGAEFQIDILGKGGVPPVVAGDNPLTPEVETSYNRDVLAVVLSVVVADPEAKGNLAVYPTGSAAGTSSLINFFPGRNVPNVAIVGVGADGTITAKLTTPLGNSKANVIVDVFGWISTSSALDGASNPARGARFVAAGPGRILDTRLSSGVLGAGQSLALPIRGADAIDPAITDIVPNDPSITGVMVNLTAINRQPASRRTFVAITPDAPGGTAPTTSNINVVGNHVKATMAIVPIGADGSIHLYNHAGEIHLAVDVLGYLKAGVDVTTDAGRVVPLEAPFRVFDTREAAFGNKPLSAGQAEDWSFKAFAESVTLDGIPLGPQSAMIGNLTGTGLTRLYPTVPVTTFLSMYPPPDRPETSNLNVPEGENVPNMSMLRYGANSDATDTYVVQAYNHNGSLHYLLDVYAVVLAD